jgi:diguanylate cyclase (GGDEF)-like protein/PAS domain S-box-containing protein
VLIWVSDPQGARSFFNRAWHDYVGISEEDAAEARWSERIHPEDRVQYLATLKTLYGHPAASQTEYRLRGADGNYRWFLERILPRLDSEDCLAGFIASATDITEIKQAEALLTETNKHLEEEVARRTEQLEQLMLTDPLTGIGNRRLLMKKLAEEVTRAHRYRRPLTVCFFDIDHFKAVNDDFGHAVGDAALAGVASVLKNCLRSCDLVGRFGGEEFVVLMPETDAAIGIQVADRLRQEIETTTFAEVPRSITVSAGLAELVRKESAESIIERSDRALYQAKRTGRNRCCLDDSLSQH